MKLLAIIKHVCSLASTIIAAQILFMVIASIFLYESNEKIYIINLYEIIIVGILGSVPSLLFINKKVSMPIHMCITAFLVLGYLNFFASIYRTNIFFIVIFFIVLYFAIYFNEQKKARKFAEEINRRIKNEEF